MRITTDEMRAIIDTLSSYINSNAELRLFGSRANLRAKGGDIDLLLIMESDEEKSALLVYKSDMLSTMKEQIGDQKIDLLIRSKEEVESDIFVQTILPDSICLKEWIL